MNHQLKIGLPPDLYSFVMENCGKHGLYQDAEEFIRDLVRREFIQQNNSCAPQPLITKSRNTKDSHFESQKLLPNQQLILRALYHSENELSRDDLRRITGIQKNYSKYIKGPTNDRSSGLEPLGLITSARYAGARTLFYSLSNKGRKLASSLFE
ncbi:MAG: hypothetical protein CMJ78_25595 [Planctomycetaceae bacterium]|nr:hypothetical protein [Planctomycetaceae bacterium]